MKKGLLLCLFLSTTFYFYSQHVSSDYAKKAAIAFLKDKKSSELRSSTSLELKTIQTEVIASDTLLYVFEETDNNGFVIVSADFRAEPILGYSTKQGIESRQGLPPALIDLINAYKVYIRDIKKQTLLKSSSKNSKWEEVMNPVKLRASQAVIRGPLITTGWNQWKYYNDFCPNAIGGSLNGYNGKVPTGCVATAMAQIMRYWSYPKYGVDSHTYTHATYGTLSADFTGEYKWAEMPNAAPPVFGNEVAKVIYHCGVSVNMDYGWDGSGAYTRNAAESFKKYFKYASSTSYYRKDYTNGGIGDAQWIQMIKNELDNNRPVLYGGQSASGGGHAFICDGYDSDDRFNFNFGWGNSGDGFFNIAAITYCLDMEAIIGIAPQSIVTTLEKKTINGNQVNFFGTINPDGTNVSSVRFELYENGNLTPVYVNATVGTSSAQGLVEVTTPATTLQYGITYTYRLTGKDKNNTTINGEFFTVTVLEDSWVQQTSGTSNHLNSIHMLSETTGYICGNGGVILKTINGGRNWITQTSGVTYNLIGIQFLNANIGFAISSSGKILKTTNGGSSWSTIHNNSTTLQYYGGKGGLYVENENKIWIACNNGTFIYDGNASLESKRGGTSFSICRVNPATVALGCYSNYGVIYSSDGGTIWYRTSIAQSASLEFIYSVASSGDNYVIGCGGNGVLYKMNCNDSPPTEIALTSPVTTNLNGITFSSVSDAYAVGNNGVIIKTTDKGSSWNVVSPTAVNTNNLNSISFPSATKGWTVGNNGTILYCGPAFLAVNPLSGTVGPAVNNNTTFTVETSLSTWTASSLASWLTVTPNTSTGVLTVTANEANPTINPRTATVIVSGVGVSSVELTITQSGAAPLLSISPHTAQTIEAPANSNKVFSVTTTLTGWSTVSSDPTWLDATSDIMVGTITVKALTTNNTGSNRTATITVSGSGVSPVVLSITQKKLDARTLKWNGSYNEKWGDYRNWETQAGVPIGSGETPDQLTTVVIAAGKSTYPVLDEADPTAVCKDIYFEHGGEVARTDLMQYEKAFVDMTLLGNRWYMLSAPLQSMFPGDYYKTSPNPITDGLFVYTQLYKQTNPQGNNGNTSLGAGWTGTFNTPDIQMPAGFGFAVWLDDGAPMAIQNPINISFPKHDTEYYYYKANGTPFGSPIPLERVNEHKFIYEPVLENGIITLSASALAGHTAIVGNPFMSHWSFNEFYQQNATIVEEYKLLVNSDDGAFTTYRPDLTNGLSDFIAPMQSIVVTASSDFNQLKTPVTSSKTNPGNILRNSKELHSSLLEITASFNNQQNKTAILFSPEASGNKFRLNEDSYKLFVESATEPIVVYTRSSDGYALDINVLGDNTQIIPIGIRTSKTGKIKLQFSALTEFFSEYDVYFNDTQNNKKVKLDVSSEYEFDKTSSELFLDGRFYLSFNKVITDIDNIQPSSIVINTFKNQLQIISHLNLKDVEIFDIQGKRIANMNNLNKPTYTHSIEYNQFYIVKASDEQSVIVKKIIIRK